MASGLRNPAVKITEEQKIENAINKLKKQRDGFNGPVSRINKYDINTTEYNKAVKDKQKLDKDISDLEVKLANLQKSSTEIALQKAKDSGNTDEANRIQEKLNGINATINNPYSPEISGPKYVEGDTLGNALRDKGLLVDTDENGTSRVISSMQGYEGQGSEHFFWASQKDKDIDTQVAFSYNQIEKKILEDANRQPGGMQALFDRLYKAQLIKKDTYDSKKLESSDFAGGLMYALREYSKKVVRDYEVGGVKQPLTFNDYLDKEFKPAGPTIRTSTLETTRDTAASDLDRFFMEYLGTGATKEQHDEYYKQLRALEKKAVRTSIDSGDASKIKGEYLDELDKIELKRKVAGKALNGSDIDKILKGGAGAAQAVNNVLSYAKRYGVNISNKDALSYVANELSAGQEDMKKVNAKILAISKSTYGNLSDLISEDVNLSELSTNYKYAMGQLLELDANAIDVMDPTIQTALKNNGNKGTMNLTDFDRMLRNDPRWGKTKNAREEASKYAYEVLKDFGLMA